DSVGSAFAAPVATGFRVLGSRASRASKTCIVCATSFTNDSFCGAIVSGSDPVFVVISPFGSRLSVAAEGVVFPGVLVHAVATSPAIMSRDRSDHKPLLRRMHCLLLIRADTRDVVAWSCESVEVEPVARA